jgi:hypothetical protein
MVSVVSEAFVDAMTRLAAIPDGRCSEPWEWPGHSGFPLQVRDALYRSLEEELEAVAAQAPPASEPARLLGAGQRAWGELRGLLVGLPDGLLELKERAAEEAGAGWTLRQMLGHVLLTERRYREQVEYALRRSDADPIRVEPKAALSEADQLGGTRDWIRRIAAEREAVARLRDIRAEQLLRPTVWVGYAVDVRFRLLRFAAHLVEHTVQAEKLLASQVPPLGEAHLIVRRISAARGAHELFTERQELERLDAAHGRRAAALESPP